MVKRRRIKGFKDYSMPYTGKQQRNNSETTGTRETTAYTGKQQRNKQNGEEGFQRMPYTGKQQQPKQGQKENNRETTVKQREATADKRTGSDSNKRKKQQRETETQQTSEAKGKQQRNNRETRGETTGKQLKMGKANANEAEKQRQKHKGSDSEPENGEEETNKENNREKQETKTMRRLKMVNIKEDNRATTRKQEGKQQMAGVGLFDALHRKQQRNKDQQKEDGLNKGFQSPRTGRREIP
ncbi:octapeptide-repeat protein T2-like [Macrobrachium rosenbergii]|uniref:octapeptide-repeat protein T2-like n=1 Tax=Macrobrachium rosenbergii TaxID=79674 RepID=UPI0034D5B0B8